MQSDLFNLPPAMPAGFSYQAELITPEQESQLLDEIRQLPFRNFEFHGYTGNRRVVSYGWRYDYDNRMIRKADDIPPFLSDIRINAARFAGLDPSTLQQALVTEYDAGAGIGWHRDKPEYGEVIGVSLLSSCVFRLRRKAADTWDRASITAARRSCYLMSGDVRWKWEHSIPEVSTLRYSITFRNLRSAAP